MANTPTNSFSTLSFDLISSTSVKFGPRLGKASLKRDGDTNAIYIQTPGLLTTTSRGVIPHLSQDHRRATQAIQWVHIPFETFLEHNPPVPTLHGGSHPLHKFLGYSLSQNVVVMSVRDPFDGREMPSNGKDHITAFSLRGVRKISPSTWRSYTLSCNPDIIVALSDTPYTKPPYSQKRLTKSLERSTAWLSDILQPLNTIQDSDLRPHALNVLVQMVGGASAAARNAFSDGLMETLYGKEAEAVKPLKCLDEGVKGYVFDLVPLRSSLAAEAHPGNSSPPVVLDTTTTPTATQRIIDTSEITPFIQASLNSLPTPKLRLVNSALSPHEILRLIRDVGIDIFDAHWAQRAADIGVALDFRFPIPGGEESLENEKHDLGHNLYDPVYAHDFKKFADCFMDGENSLLESSNAPVCPCTACSPLPPSTHISHSSIDFESYTESAQLPPKFLPPFTRAYIHHLLHTHEMSSHSLLAMHNLSVLDAFLSGVRSVLSEANGEARFRAELENFVEFYDENMTVFDEARKSWTEVAMARGKGRLVREKVKQTESTLGTAVEL